MKHNAAAYAPLSVVGLEIEYAVVDGNLRPACVVADAFREVCGRPADVSRGRIGFSNELAAHVLELKMIRPSADLRQMESDLHAGVGVHFVVPQDIWRVERTIHRAGVHALRGGWRNARPGGCRVALPQCR